MGSVPIDRLAAACYCCRADVRTSRTQQHVAVKIFRRRGNASHPVAAHIKREIAMLRLVRDDPGSARHVVNLLQVYTSRQCVHLVLELVANGDLFSLDRRVIRAAATHTLHNTIRKRPHWVGYI